MEYSIGKKPGMERMKYVTLSVLGMLGLSCYILADTFFVAQALGTKGLTALNLSIPIYSFVHGSGLMLGMGGASRYSVLHSRGDQDAQRAVLAHALGLVALFAVFFVTAGVLFAGRIAQAWGAEQAVCTMSETYVRTILIFSPLFLLNNVLLCFVRNDGAPKRAMAAMLIGSFSNIVLDYLFIFPLGMGMFGAALATGIAPGISLLVLSPHLKRAGRRLRPMLSGLQGRIVRRILSGGFPSLITEIASGLVMLVWNAVILRLQGGDGVAAYGVIANVSLVVLSMYTGVAQGVQPLISRDYGAGRNVQVRATFHYAIAVLLGLSVLLYAGVFFGAEWIVRVFNSEQNAQLQRMAVPGLRIYFMGCVFAGFNILLSIFFPSLERPAPAHLLSMLRGWLLIIPMTLLCAALGGVTGVWLSFGLTEALVSLVGMGCIRRMKDQAVLL